MNSLVTTRKGSLDLFSYARSRTSTLGRKRNRLGLAKFASALAISISAVGAFQPTLPNRYGHDSMLCSPVSGYSLERSSASASASSSRLSVVTDPELFLREQVTLSPTAPLARQLNGAKKVKRRVPPKIKVKSRSAATLPKAVASKQTKATTKKTKTTTTQEDQATTETTGATTAALASALPAREKKERNARKKSTMPGFQNGAMTGRQKAFRDGIRLVESRTGRKYVESAEARKKRRQMNGEAMYKSSASVPDSLVHFANEIHKVERITPKEEIELGELTQEAIRLQSLHEDLTDKLSRPPTDEEWCAAAGKINLEALSQAIEDGLEAKNKLVTSNLRMVQGVVNLYIRNGLGGQYNAGDLMQEGIMALIRAAEKFDPNRGFRFSTYAMYWIRSAVKRSQIVQSRVITVPQRLYENHKRLLRTEKEMREVLGRMPTRKELGDAVGMSEVQVERCITAMNQRCFSLDQGIQNTKKPMDSTRSDTLIDIVDSRTDDGEYDKQRHVFLREDLIETLNRHLTEEEVELLLLRYGLHDELDYGDGPMTIANVSRIVGLKPDKVRRMINKSLKQLQASISDEWSDFEREFQH